jgi:hypothetical protein
MHKYDLNNDTVNIFMKGIIDCIQKKDCECIILDKITYNDYLTMVFHFMSSKIAEINRYFKTNLDTLQSIDIKNIKTNNISLETGTHSIALNEGVNVMDKVACNKFSTFIKIKPKLKLTNLSIVKPIVMQALRKNCRFDLFAGCVFDKNSKVNTDGSVTMCTSKSSENIAIQFLLKYPGICTDYVYEVETSYLINSNNTSEAKLNKKLHGICRDVAPCITAKMNTTGNLNIESNMSNDYIGSYFSDQVSRPVNCPDNRSGCLVYHFAIDINLTDKHIALRNTFNGKEYKYANLLELWHIFYDSHFDRLVKDEYDKYFGSDTGNVMFPLWQDMEDLEISQTFIVPNSTE